MKPGAIRGRVGPQLKPLVRGKVNERLRDSEDMPREFKSLGVLGDGTLGR